MLQATCWPTWPVSAAQRMGTCSVPRMRQVLPFTSRARPSGTVPPMACISYTAKFTRKLAQQAPQLRHGWAESAVVMVVASSDM